MYVMHFDGYYWKETHVMSLIENDLVFYQGELIQVTGQPTMKNNTATLPSKTYYSPNTAGQLAIGKDWKNREATVRVMDYTNSTCHDFGDGTYILALLEAGPGAVYSPRLSAEKLEAWCQSHIEKFLEIYAENKPQIDNGETLIITPWWGIKTTPSDNLRLTTD